MATFTKILVFECIKFHGVLFICGYSLIIHQGSREFSVFCNSLSARYFRWVGSKNLIAFTNKYFPLHPGNHLFHALNAMLSYLCFIIKPQWENFVESWRIIGRRFYRNIKSTLGFVIMNISTSLMSYRISALLFKYILKTSFYVLAFVLLSNFFSCISFLLYQTNVYCNNVIDVWS